MHGAMQIITGIRTCGKQFHNDSRDRSIRVAAYFDPPQETCVRRSGGNSTHQGPNTPTERIVSIGIHESARLGRQIYEAAHKISQIIMEADDAWSRCDHVKEGRSYACVRAPSQDHA